MTNSDLVALLEIFQDSLESRVTTERELTRQRPYSQDVLDNLNAALAALRSGEVVLVPKEPTEEQIIAARYDWYHEHGPQSSPLYGEQLVGIYRAMLACAKGKP